MKTLEEIISEHQEMLYPVVRVRTEKAGGSGIIVYSKPLPDGSNKYETYVLTCHHVVEDAIKFIQKYSDIARRTIEVEDKALVHVETFEYEELSRVVGGTSYNAEIITWDKQLDIALLKVLTNKQFVYVAKLYPKGKEEEMKLGMEAAAVGCSLGHEPMINYGNLMAKHDRIENKEYWMSTANIIFGNSGGAEFLLDGHQFIGITARVSGVQLGFGLDIITWMGFFVPITSIYNFLEEKIFQFIYDPNFTSKQCEEMRKKKQEEEERKLYLPPELMHPSKRGKAK